MTENVKQQNHDLLFNELNICLRNLNGYDLNNLIPLIYVLCAHHQGHLLSIHSHPSSKSIFSGEWYIEPLLDQDLNDVESPLLKEIRNSVDEKFFIGQTAQHIYRFYSKCNQLINDFYEEVIEYVISFTVKYSGRLSGIFSTPVEIASLIYKLALDYAPKSIYDPCAGLCTGATLDFFNGVDFFAQELHPLVKVIADVRMDAHGRHYPCVCEDSVFHWKGEEGFDCLCSDLPFGTKIDDQFHEECRSLNLEDLVISRFIKSPSLKRAVLLTSLSTCSRPANFDVRKTLCDRNYIDMVIELPKGVLPATGVGSVILVLNKERTTKNIKFISATDCIKNVSQHERIVDMEKVLARVSGVDKTKSASCDKAKTFDLYCSLDPSDYIKEDIPVLPGQKLVSISEIAKQIRGSRSFEEIEGYVLKGEDLCDSLMELQTRDVELTFESFDEASRYEKIAQPCVIFSLRQNQFFIKSDDTPLFIRPSLYQVFAVDTNKCSLEYFAYLLITSKQIQAQRERSYTQAHLNVRSILLPFFEDKESQKQIIIRLYREAESELRKKMDKLQAVSGHTSDLLHNLGVTFNKIGSGIACLQQSEQQVKGKLDSKQINLPVISKCLYDNLQFALRQINCNGTDFSQIELTHEKTDILRFINEYIDAWRNFGFGSFEILPIDSSLSKSGPTLVDIDRNLIYTLLDCILINAHQHGFSRRKVYGHNALFGLHPVTITSTIHHTETLNPYDEEVVDRYVLISVSNNGNRFPDGFTPEDFIERYKVGINSDQDGLGGYHIHQIARRHGGKLSIESDNQWLSFNVLIPLYASPKDTVFEEYECEFL